MGLFLLRVVTDVVIVKVIVVVADVCRDVLVVFAVHCRRPNRVLSRCSLNCFVDVNSCNFFVVFLVIVDAYLGFAARCSKNKTGFFYFTKNGPNTLIHLRHLREKTCFVLFCFVSPLLGLGLFRSNERMLGNRAFFPCCLLILENWFYLGGKI